MFDIDTFIADASACVGDADPRGAVHDLLRRTLLDSESVAAALGKDEGGIEVLHAGPDLTVLNVIWAPHMTIYPHEHRMWATIGIYGGAELNQLYRRGTERLQVAGDRLLDTRDVFGLGRDAIHSVHNPRKQFTGAIHVYGGDFVNEPRSQWDPDTLLEEPYDMAEVQRRFAEANEQWRAQLGQDLDEATIA
jgi:predicted metal-dependent enzyme (double-stranded beta helix superfamily)